jgi:hypothetical protein
MAVMTVLVTVGSGRRQDEVPDIPGSDRCLSADYLLPRLAGQARTIIVDKGYAGRELAECAATLGITIIRPARADEPNTSTSPA